ncbi:hypothetical protein [Pseudonocardia sp.]|uniref:hypothetical protein n=1 Tax=Pseudonocardia sp. TaxID=60912 RepID=UPI002636AB36|nr:hypothetical protein [Pseudonocardia sp.]
MENSARGLTMLEPDHKVVVTGEEHHQPALTRYAPRTDGRARRVAVELGFATAPRGGQVIEVRLDGRPVGWLTPLMSQRYGPLVDEVRRRGDRPGAVALVIDGRRGVEVELRLPDAPVGASAPRPPGHPPVPGPDAGRPEGRRRGRLPLLVGGGVLTVLLAVGAAVGGGADESATTASASRATVDAVSPTTTRPTTAPPSSSPPTTPPTDRATASATGVGPDPVDAPVRPPTRTAQPRVATAEPEPAPAPQPLAAPAPSGCHPSYTPCVPDGPDLNCGDLDGPYTVTGPDTFRLDSNDDGIGCEG